MSFIFIDLMYTNLSTTIVKPKFKTNHIIKFKIHP
jgi:hypothetical protein